RTRHVSARLAAVALCAIAIVACSSGSTSTLSATSTTKASKTAAGDPGNAAYLVYWDQNEEEDVLSIPSGTQAQLQPPWDPNGQMCVLADGRFVVGYDPTLPAQHNLGGLKSYKQPADGVELNEPNGSFSGQTLYVPGPYKMAGQSI